MNWPKELPSLSLDPVSPWTGRFGLPLLGIVGLVVIVLTVWTYSGSRRIGRRRLALVLGLRLIALVLAILVLVRPSFTSPDPGHPPTTLIVLLDASASMTSQDEFDRQSRWEYLRRLVKESRPRFERLQTEQNVAVSLYAFAEDLREFDPDGNADGKRTDFGQALHALCERYGHDRNLRGLAILSDGGDNGTRFPALPEGTKWRALSCPISTFAFGKPTAVDRQRDVALVRIQPVPAVVPVKGKLTVKATIDAPGFENATATVHLLIDDKEVLSEPQVLRKASENKVRLNTKAPDKPGEIKVTVRVDPLPGEMTLVNNEISTFVTVDKEGISVLLIDRPRFPEPQLLCDALRSDRRIDLSAAWLRSDEPSPDEKDLFQFKKQQYDVIIMGDVSVRRLNSIDTDTVLSIQKLVAQKGAGLLMMGGYDSFGNGDWPGSPMETLAPVELQPAGQVEGRWSLKPTRAGLNHYIMRLSENLSANKDLWERLPKMNGLSRFGKEKAGATVLAVRGENDEPVLVSQDYGEGRTLAFAGDTTWRWQRLGQPRSTEGVAAHARFWKQVVFWLAKRDKTEGSVWVKPDTRRLPAGGKLGFTVGLRGKGGLEAPRATFEARVIGPRGVEYPVPTAREENGERGAFWKTDVAGEYRLVVKGRGQETDGQPIAPGEASARFLVYEDDAETLRRAADHDFLNKLAVTGGGKAYTADAFPRFLEEIEKQPAPQLKPKTEAWPDWRSSTLSGFRVGIFLIFVGLLCLEWLLRRVWGLV